jgi:hypothetical protein
MNERVKFVPEGSDGMKGLCRENEWVARYQDAGHKPTAPKVPDEVEEPSSFALRAISKLAELPAQARDLRTFVRSEEDTEDLRLLTTRTSREATGVL